MHKSYRHRISIQAPVVADGNYGKRSTFTGGQMVFTNLPADFEHIGGTETKRGEQVQPDVVGIFEVREQRVAIKPTYQLLHVNAGNKAYGIVSVRPKENDEEGGFRKWLIYVKAIADA